MTLWVEWHYVHILIPGTCGCYLIWKKGIIKDFEMISSWIIWVKPKSLVRLRQREIRKGEDTDTQRSR